MKEHTHCPICEKPFEDRKELEKHFKKHSKQEHLKWLSKEIMWFKTNMYDLLQFIDYIVDKYNF